MLYGKNMKKNYPFFRVERFRYHMPQPWNV